MRQKPARARSRHVRLLRVAAAWCRAASQAVLRTRMRMRRRRLTSPLSILLPVACCTLNRGCCLPQLMLYVPLMTESSAVGDMYAAPLLPMLRRGAVAALSVVTSCCCSDRATVLRCSHAASYSCEQSWGEQRQWPNAPSPMLR